jgi:carbon monoxide dehydrogenase subunit G
VKLEQSFDVAAPLERVWQALIDVERVAPCLPGATVTARNEDGSYNGAFSVKIGPTSASYTGKLEMEQIDEEAHVATMQAHGTDKRGQGGAKATIVSRLSPADGEGTRVEVVTDYHITGRLARFGRGGMIEDISERLLREFAHCLQTRLAEEPDGSSSAAAEDATSAAPSPGSPDDQPTRVGGPSSSPAGSGGAGDQPTLVGGTSGLPVGSGGAGDQPTLVGGTSGLPVGSGGAGDQPTLVGGTSGSPVGSEGAGDHPTAVGAGSGSPTGPHGADDSGGADGSGFRTPTTVESQSPEASEPLDGLSLMASVLWSRVRRNPAPIIAAVIGFLVAVVLLRRPRR